TVFNEGWGQFDADNCYETLKSKDPTRIFDTASGWFKPKKSDVESEHIYFKPIRLSGRKKPLVLSEYGGYSYRVEGHIFNLDKNYGYKSFKTQAEFENALISLFENELVGAIENGLCGAIYTQLSDVEDETNGLLTYDRAVLKVDPDRLKKSADMLYSAFEKISRKRIDE
ncbi:MAG: glycoside hydrolase family 2, partial [Clostridia bacterium]|nr:glycoside hydrolase family 2 [Clostridia bacterium]